MDIHHVWIIELSYDHMGGGYKGELEILASNKKRDCLLFLTRKANGPFFANIWPGNFVRE